MLRLVNRSAICDHNSSSHVLLGNPNEPEYASVYWPLYERVNKSFISFNALNTHIEDNFLEERFQFWDSVLHRPMCAPFRWYHTCLLIGILVIVLSLLSIYIFYNAKRSRRNIKPTEVTNTDTVTTYRFTSDVVS